MPNTYSLTVVNQSEMPTPKIAVFADLPSTSSYETLNLAWLTRQIDATNRYTFTWEVTWGFAWSAQGAGSGYTWSGSGSLPADPTSPSGCAVTFTNDGDFRLVPTSGVPDGETLSIYNSTTLPREGDQASTVSVTLGGNAVSATQAGPNLVQTYTLHPTYYIDAGTYQHGQMVDVASVTQFQKLAYTDGNTALTATLGPQNTWTVQPTAQVLANA